MTAGEAQDLTSSLRRQITLTRVARIVILTVLGLGFAVAPIIRDAPVRWQALWSALTIAGMAWIVMTAVSVRQIRSANQASAFIASGRLDLAEAQLIDAVRRFSLYRNGKLLACHNLAVVAHGQRSYRAAAELCDCVISLVRGIERGLGRTCRIMLADCRLFLGETTEAIEALSPLSLRDVSMSLAEQLLLLPIQLRCQIATGQYETAIEDLAWKVRRAELLDSPKAALAHALLSKACRQTGDVPQADFLWSRATLYHDIATLAEDYPVLRNSDSQAISADNN